MHIVMSSVNDLISTLLALDKLVSKLDKRASRKETSMGTRRSRVLKSPSKLGPPSSAPSWHTPTSRTPTLDQHTASISERTSTSDQRTASASDRRIPSTSDPGTDPGEGHGGQMTPPPLRPEKDDKLQKKMSYYST